MNILKDKRVTIRATIIMAGATIIATIIGAVINIFPEFVDTSESDGTPVVHDTILNHQPPLTPEIGIQPSDSIYETSLSHGGIYFRKGDDVDLVQFTVDTLKSKFGLNIHLGEMEVYQHFNYFEAFDKYYDEIESNLGEVYFLTDSLFTIEFGVPADVYFEDTMESLREENRFTEILDSIASTIKPVISYTDSISPVFDVTLFNRSNKNLILTNLKIELIGTYPVGYGGGEETLLFHSDTIKLSNVYNIKLPKRANLQYDDLDLKSPYWDSYLNKWKEETDRIREGEQAPFNKKVWHQSLAEELYLTKIDYYCADLEPFNYNLTPPINIAPKNPARIQFRVFHQGYALQEFQMIIHFIFFNSSTDIGIPVTIMM